MYGIFTIMTFSVGEKTLAECKEVKAHKRPLHSAKLSFEVTNVKSCLVWPYGEFTTKTSLFLLSNPPSLTSSSPVAHLVVVPDVLNMLLPLQQLH